jgi:hypothetical protein
MCVCAMLLLGEGVCVCARLCIGGVCVWEVRLRQPHCHTLSHTVSHTNTLLHTVPHCHSLSHRTNTTHTHTNTHTVTHPTHTAHKHSGRHSKRKREEGRGGGGGGGHTGVLVLAACVPSISYYQYIAVLIYKTVYLHCTLSVLMNDGIFSRASNPPMWMACFNRQP